MTNEVWIDELVAQREAHPDLPVFVCNTNYVEHDIIDVSFDGEKIIVVVDA